MWKCLPTAAVVVAASCPVMAQPSADTATTGAAGATASQGEGQIVLFVFDGDAPVSGARLLADGQSIGKTGADGGAVAKLAAGQHNLVLRQGSTNALDLDVITRADEQVRIIATLRDGQAPELNIQGGGSGPVLAGATDAGEDAGTINGVVTGPGGGPLSGATVRVPARGVSAETGADGRFAIDVPPGTYNLRVTHPNYTSGSAAGLRVAANGQATANVSLSDSGIKLADYTVTAEYLEGSIASEIELQRESDQITSVIGAEQIARTGDANAAEALQRVSGLLIENNKYAVIRGQPYRYTLTTFNGLPLPSPDPIIEAVPLNLFTDTILANIQVQKSYSADKPGNFGGGLVALNTISTPDEPFATFKISTGANTLATGELGLTYKGSNEDPLGQDGGERELPGGVPDGDTLAGFTQAERQAVGRSFDDFYIVEEKQLPADIGAEAAAGRSFDTDYGTFGAIVTGTYSHEYRRQIEQDNSYTASQDDPRISFLENRTDRQVQLSGFLALSGEWDNHAVKSNTLFVRDSQDRTQISEGYDLTSDGRDERRFLLEFQRRDLFLTQLLGEHDFKWFQVDWRGQHSETERDRPDRSSYRYQRPFGSDRLPSFYADTGLERDFNEVNGQLDSGNGDVTIPLPDIGDFKWDLRGGGDINVGSRDSNTRRFQFIPQNDVRLDRHVIEQIINDNKIRNDGSGVAFNEVTLASDSYTADTDTRGYYIGGHMGFDEWIETDFGVRNTNANYEVITGGGTVGGFDREFWLPSVNVTGSITDELQLRASYGQSVSYPRLVELAETTFFNPDTGEQFIGNAELAPTEIDSYDLRLEFYPSSTENLNLGVFYKQLENSIEQQFLPLASGTSLTSFTNGQNGEILGLETGGRVSFDRVVRAGWVPFDWVANTYFQANFALSNSSVELDPEASGAATNQRRPLTGQADTTLNLQLGYDGDTQDFTLLYNRVGSRLDQAGTNNLPDIYQQPISFLGFTYSLDLPTRLPFIGPIPTLSGAQIKFKGANLLNAEREYRQGERLQRRVEFGRSFSASLRLNLF